MDSAAAAAGLAALRSQDERTGIEYFYQVQQAFYGEGRSLSDPETYVRIATASGLDPDRTRQMLASGEAAKLAQADFTLARTLGATTYPTPPPHRREQRPPLAGASAWMEVMNCELSQALAAFESAA